MMTCFDGIPLAIVILAIFSLERSDYSHGRVPQLGASYPSLFLPVVPLLVNVKSKAAIELEQASKQVKMQCLPISFKKIEGDKKKLKRTIAMKRAFSSSEKQDDHSGNPQIYGNGSSYSSRRRWRISEVDGDPLQEYTKECCAPPFPHA